MSMSNNATLFELICDLAAYNQMNAVPESKWPSLHPFDIKQLNDEASSLTPELQEIFIDGDIEDARAIAFECEIEYLHLFLNFVFNGDYELMKLGEEHE